MNIVSESDYCFHRQVDINSPVVVARLTPNTVAEFTRVNQVEKRIVRDLSKVSVRGPEGLLYRHFRLVDPEQITVDRIKRRWPSPIQQIRAGSKWNILLAGKNYSNEGHFVFQHLPRLLTVLNVIGNWRPEDLNLLVNPGQRALTERWLDFYGLPRFCVVSIDNQSARWDLWYCPMPRNKLGIITQDDLALFDTYCKYFSTDDRVQKKDLFDVPTFVLRGELAKRRLLNEAEILDVVSNFYGGVKIVDFSTDSRDEILQTFQRSSLIFGASGMGFSPAILSRYSDVAVLGNKYSPINWHLRYASIASMRGNKGFTLNCSVDSSVSFHDDFIFPEKLLISQLEQMEKLRERV
jgi:hypothetical protein